MNVMNVLKFNGSSGRKPSAEARRYVYAVLATSLEVDLYNSEGWVFGRIDSELDRQRVRDAARKIVAELRGKASR